jgi:hypothetical protein
MRTRFVILLALLGLTWCTSTGMLGGCSMFEPARAEPPVNSNSIREDFSSPDATLETISRAFAAKTSGATTYLDCLANTEALSYTAVFDAAVLQAYPGSPPSEWTASYELAFYNHFIEKRISGRDSVSFDSIAAQPDPDPDPNHPDLLVINRHYEAWDIVTEGEAITHTRQAIGNATLTFVRISSRWLILTWTDKVDPDIGVNPVETGDRTFSWRRLEATGGS